MSKETRVLSIPASELRATSADGKLSLEGYAIRYNSLSQMIGGDRWGFRERIHPDAFKEQLNTSPDIMALAYHDPAKPIGRTPDTLKLDNRADGLFATIALPDTQYARDLHASVQRGDVSGMSFGFRTLTDTWGIEDGSEVRTVVKAELVEVSPTTFPAYSDTSVAARSWQAAKEAARPRRRDALLGKILAILE